MINYFNDADIAKETLSSGFTPQKFGKELSVVCRYLRFIGKEDKEIDKIIEDLVSKYSPQLLTIKKMDMMDSIIANSKNMVLKQIDGVYMSKQDLDVVGKIRDKEIKKVLWTLICLGRINYRLYDSFYINEKFSTIASMANISIKRKLPDYLRELAKFNIIRMTISGGIEMLNFSYWSDDTESSICFIKDLDNCGNYYEMITHNNYKECNCGRLFRRARNRNNCKACSDLNRINSTRKRVEKHRANM